MIRLLALDLDGTLMGDDGAISARNRRALSAALERGVAVTLATGRMFQAALPIARHLGIASPLICYQGSLIRAPACGCEAGSPAPLLHRTLPLPLARRVVRWARERDLAVSAYLDDQLYTDRVTEATLFDARLSRVELHPVADLLDLLSAPPTKLAMVTDDARAVALARELSAELDGRLRVVRTHPRFVEAIHPQVSKGCAIAWLARHLGIPRQEVMAVGDNDNDAEMLRWAGLGVAVGNASAPAKEAADRVAPHWEDDGVAWAIEKLVLA